jgi:hypothetical protein
MMLLRPFPGLLLMAGLSSMSAARTVAILFVLSDDFEPDRDIPIDRGANIFDMNHGNNSLGHGSPEGLRCRAPM